MSTKVSDLRAALRLSRTIASDILLYNEEKIKEALMRDSLFEALEEEISEARALYDQRVPEAFQRQYRFLERALVDQLVIPALLALKAAESGETRKAHG